MSVERASVAQHASEKQCANILAELERWYARVVRGSVQCGSYPLQKGAAMCWQCDNPDGTIDEYLDTLRDTIRDHGWAVQYVESDRRPFAYTIGLHDIGLPELLMTGLQPQTSARLLNSIAHQIVDDGTFLQPAMHIDYQSEFLLEVVEVEHPDVHLKFAVELCGPRIRAFQLVWTDDHRRWPWDRGWSHGRRRQPVLGVRTPLPE